MPIATIEIVALSVIIFVVVAVVFWERTNRKRAAELGRRQQEIAKKEAQVAQAQQRLSAGAELWKNLPAPRNGKLEEPVSEKALQYRFRMKIQLAQVQLNLAISFLDRADQYLDGAPRAKIEALRSMLQTSRDQGRTLGRSLEALEPLINALDKTIEIDTDSLQPNERDDILEVPQKIVGRDQKQRLLSLKALSRPVDGLSTTVKDTPFDEALRTKPHVDDDDVKA